LKFRADDGITMARAFLLVPAVAVVLAASCGATACGGGQPSAADDRESMIYAATIRAVVGDDAKAGRSDRPVFVAPLDSTKPIPLEIQAGVVDQLSEDAEFASIRFVDKAAEAIDEGRPDQPVVQQGILVRIAPVATSGDDVVVRAERYENADEIRRYRVRLTRNGSTWSARFVEATRG
jgi:hypothetical protein